MIGACVRQTCWWLSSSFVHRKDSHRDRSRSREGRDRDKDKQRDKDRDRDKEKKDKKKDKKDKEEKKKESKVLKIIEEGFHHIKVCQIYWCQLHKFKQTV